MGAKIPQEIKLEVMRKWLEGKSRDMIAHESHIGTGTVSGIIKEFRLADFDADLLREVSLELKSRGLDIQSFAALVRLKQVMEEMGWIMGVKPGNNNNGDGYGGGGDDDLDQFVEKKMESLIMSLEVFCFKQNLPVKQFFDCIHSMYLLAERLGFPLEDIPVYIEEQEARIKDLSEQIKYWESEKQAALEKCQTTEKLLEEFELSRPMFDSNQQLKQELEQVTKERDKYKFELENERIWKRKEEEFEWLIAVPELEKANKELKHKAGQYNTCQYVSPRYLKEMVMAVYHNPSKYVDIISKLMERYHPEHSSKEAQIK